MEYEVKVIGELELLDRIKEAVLSLDDGEEMARIHNELHHEKVRYLGDSLWELTGERMT